MEERGGEEIHRPQLEHPSFSSWLLIYATNTRLHLYIGSLALKWKLGDSYLSLDFGGPQMLC